MREWPPSCRSEIPTGPAAETGLSDTGPLSARNRVETLLPYLPVMDVALIRWPSDEGLRTELAEQGHPRLLLVSPDSDPPVCTDLVEDWVRLPVSRADRTARISMIESRLGNDRRAKPSLDADGMLEHGGLSARLSPLQTDLLGPMIDRFGAVVSRDVLTAAAWPGSSAPGNTLDVTVSRLRRQLRPLGLRIRTVRARGYLLTDEPPSHGSSSPV